MGNGSEIAAEIAAALREAAEAVGDTDFTCCIRRQSNTPASSTNPYSSAEVEPEYEYVDLGGLRSTARVRVELPSGDFVNKLEDTLTLESSGFEPRIGDEIAVGVSHKNVTPETQWSTIETLDKISPAGWDLLYKATLKTGGV